MNIGLVVSDDLDYGLDLANALGGKGDALTLYLSHTNLAYYLGESSDASSSELLLDSLYRKRLVPESVTVRLFHFPRMRDPRSTIAVARLKTMIETDQLNVVHILMGPGELWIAVLACLIRKMPVVSTMIIPQPNVGEKLPVFILWAIAKLLAIGSDLIIVNGAEQVEVVQRLYSVPTYKVTYVSLIPRIAAARWAQGSCAEEAYTVLFPGKAQPRKGLEYLIRAQPFVSREIPNAHFLIAAHGEDLPRCRQLIEDESKFEICEGFLTSAKLAEYFQRASLVALPYISASTSGMLTTAYVFGKPVVTTNVGALPEYVKEGETGFLVPPADPEALANAIVGILQDDILHRRMQENAKAWVQHEQECVALATRQVYLKAVQRL
jgi:alpha-maltose-1-phosphate synthase